jgi:hypothetical protein
MVTRDNRLRARGTYAALEFELQRCRVIARSLGKSLVYFQSP